MVHISYASGNRIRQGVGWLRVEEEVHSSLDVSSRCSQRGGGRVIIESHCTKEVHGDADVWSFRTETEPGGDGEVKQ